MGNPFEVAFVIGWFALWFLFPIGVFLSVAHVDKNTDQLIRLEKLRHQPLTDLDFHQIHKVTTRPGFFGQHWDFTFGRGLRH